MTIALSAKGDGGPQGHGMADFSLPFTHARSICRFAKFFLKKLRFFNKELQML
jgi:hypothetical protein